MNEEEKTYKKLLDDLKNLPRIDAPKNFETELLRKINSSRPEIKQSFWDRLFSIGKLAPAAVAIVSAAIIFFVVDINSEVMEDPLNIAPRLREDIIVVQSIDEVPIEPLKKSEKIKEKSKETNSGLIEKKEVEEELQKNEPLLEKSNLRSKSIEQSIKDDLVFDKSDSDSFGAEETRSLGGNIVPAPVTSGVSEISKDNNLNFMQRNLSSEEKIEVQQLKKQVQAEKSSKTKQKANK
jgi:hypothetical protein